MIGANGDVDFFSFSVVAGGNVFAEATNPAAGIEPHTGSSLCKVFGQFIGGSNTTGLFQSFPATPGETFTMDCWTRHWAFDPITGAGGPNDNFATMKMAFFDASNMEIGSAERTVLDGTFPTNTWVDNPPVAGTAPPGTVTVQALLLFIQPGVGTGAAQFDDVEFSGPPTGSPTYPGTGEDLWLSSAAGGGAPTTGPGNDVKMAMAGDLLELNVSSPGGAFILTPYYLIGQLFTTGTPPVPQPAFPELWFGFASFFVLVDGAGAPILGPPLIGPNGGSSSFFVTPMGLSGSSVMVQGLVINPLVANGLYAATDAHEIQFQ